MFVEHGVERAEHRAGLHAVAARSDTEVHVGRRDAEVIEEHVGQHRVVVLTRVHDHVLDAGSGCRLGDRRELDELGASTHDADYLHVGRV